MCTIVLVLDWGPRSAKGHGLHPRQCECARPGRSVRLLEEHEAGQLPDPGTEAIRQDEFRWRCSNQGSLQALQLQHLLGQERELVRCQPGALFQCGRVLQGMSFHWAHETGGRTDKRGLLQTSQNCWDQLNTCYNEAPVTGHDGCDKWEKTCTELQVRRTIPSQREGRC